LVFNVDFYKKTDDSCPVEDFLNSLDDKMRAKVLREILLLENYGNELREPYSKPLGDGIFELRMQQGSDIARVLYFFLIGQNIILTNGFVKKTPKTPSGEIELAKKYRKDYLERKKF
jgi:phage-related protein